MRRADSDPDDAVAGYPVMTGRRLGQDQGGTWQGAAPECGRGLAKVAREVVRSVLGSRVGRRIRRVQMRQGMPCRDNLSERKQEGKRKQPG